MARVVGALLLALFVLPLHTLLARPLTGLAGAATIEQATTFRDISVTFLLVALAAALLLGGAWDYARPRLARLALNLLALRRLPFAIGCGVFAFAAAWAFNVFGLHGQPNLIDTTSQLMHARFLADGSLAAPADVASPFWHLHQTVITPNGWLSQYPPGHVALLGLATALGVTALLGPLLLGSTVAFTALLAEDALPHDRLAARLGALLAAASPFLISHAAAYMSHTTAALFAVISLYTAARSDFRGNYLLVCGAALGALLLTRPLTAVTVGAVVMGFVFARQKAAAPLQLLRLVAGALPFAVGLAAYNNHFFGHPFRFGYDVALGPNAGLGFGVDPWGNSYGLREAIGYTSAELSVLNVQLIESLLPTVLLTGTFMLITPRPAWGEWLLIAWACAPLLTHLLYWHHGLFMGPRMLNEYAPAWCLLFARSLTRIYHALPERPIGRYTPRALFGGAAVAGLAAMLLLVPMRLAAYAQPASAIRAEIRKLDNALVFVHGSWEERLGMQLAAAGMRLDSVEAVLRQNETCAVHAFNSARLLGQPLPALDFAPRATNLPPRVTAGPGSLIRAQNPLTPGCMREALADRFGALDVGTALLSGAKPGDADAAVLVARDLGPELNASLAAQQRNRQIYLLMPDRHGRVVALPYDQGVALLWSAQ